MDINSNMNVVVFEIKRLWKKNTFLEPTPTRAEDGIRIAWREVQAKTGAKPAQVTRIYAEWEPGAEDKAFIAATFPNVELTYSFARPTSPEGWEAAFQEANQAMQEVAAKDAIANMEEHRQQGNAVLFPVLRTYEADDVFTQIGVYRPISTDLAAFLANVGMTPRNTIGIDYVMRATVDTSEQGIASLFETAMQNLRTGLKVNVSEEGSEKLFAFSRPGYMAASALCLPEFYEQVRSWLGEEVFVAFTDPDNLFVTLPHSRFVGKLRQAVEQSEYWGSVALTPACYLLNAEGFRRVAVRISKS